MLRHASSTGDRIVTSEVQLTVSISLRVSTCSMSSLMTQGSFLCFC